MKLKFAAATVLLAGAFAQSASADVTIRITGSSAFRAATSEAIRNMMTNVTYAYTGSSYTGSSFQIVKGTLAGVAGVTTVKTNWSGAVAGTRDVAQSKVINFLADDTAVTSGGTSLATSTLLTDSSVPDVAMTDNYQASTKFPSTPSLVDAVVGVVPFAWVASKDAPAGITNMTPQLARTLFLSGYASAALFTGNNADASDVAGGNMVYAVGRDPFSGTRLISFAEAGVGVNSTVTQFTPSGTITGNILTKITLTAADAANGVIAGNNGFSSGGSLADMLRYTTTATEDLVNAPGEPRALSFVTYLGEADADRAVNGTGSSVTGAGAGGARYLTYNGVSAFGGVRATPTVSTTNASTTLAFTTGTTAGLVVGQAIKGTNIPVDSTVASIVNASSITISAAATATGTGITAIITNLLPASIRSGAYAFWGYEHILWRSSLSGDKLAAGVALRNRIKSTDYFNSGIADNDAMRVQRATDGGVIFGKYY